MPVLIIGTSTDPVVTSDEVALSCAKLGGWDGNDNEYNRQGFGVADGLEFMMYATQEPTHLPMTCGEWGEEGGMRDEVVGFLDRNELTFSSDALWKAASGPPRRLHE